MSVFEVGGEGGAPAANFVLGFEPEMGFGRGSGGRGLCEPKVGLLAEDVVIVLVDAAVVGDELDSGDKVVAELAVGAGNTRVVEVFSGLGVERWRRGLDSEDF